MLNNRGIHDSDVRVGERDLPTRLPPSFKVYKSHEIYTVNERDNLTQGFVFTMKTKSRITLSTTWTMVLLYISFRPLDVELRWSVPCRCVTLFPFRLDNHGLKDINLVQIGLV